MSHNPKNPLFRKRKILESVFKTCPRCGAGGSLTIDHLVARKDGGTNDFQNLTLLCRKCNNEKGRRCALEFFGAELLHEIKARQNEGYKQFLSRKHNKHKLAKKTLMATLRRNSRFYCVKSRGGKIFVCWNEEELGKLINKLGKDVSSVKRIKRMGFGYNHQIVLYVTKDQKKLYKDRARELGFKAFTKYVKFLVGCDIKNKIIKRGEDHVKNSPYDYGSPDFS